MKTNKSKIKNHSTSRTKVVSISIIVLMLMFTYVPIAVLAIYSFTDATVIGKWTGFTFSLYKKVFTDREIIEALKNSVLIATVSSFIACVIGTTGAVGIFYMRKHPKTILNGITQITMINADIVTGIAFMLFFIMIKEIFNGLIYIPDGYATLIIAHTIICLPYVIMSVTPKLTQLNKNVYEASLDLGASHMRTFLKVVLPQLISGVIAGFLLAFTISFDDFLVSNFNNGSIVTIPIYLYNKTKKGIVPMLRALSTLLLFAVLLVLIAVNVAASRRNKKQAQSTMLLGSVK